MTEILTNDEVLPIRQIWDSNLDKTISNEEVLCQWVILCIIVQNNGEIVEVR